MCSHLLFAPSAPHPQMAWVPWVITTFPNGECPSASNPRLCSRKPAGRPTSSRVPHCPRVPLLPRMGTRVGRAMLWVGWWRRLACPLSRLPGLGPSGSSPEEPTLVNETALPVTSLSVESRTLNAGHCVFWGSRGSPHAEECPTVGPSGQGQVARREPPPAHGTPRLPAVCSQVCDLREVSGSDQCSISSSREVNICRLGETLEVTVGQDLRLPSSLRCPSTWCLAATQ